LNFVEIGEWVLRAFGVLYCLGGVFGARQAWMMLQLEPQMDQLLDVLDTYSAGEGAPPAPARETDRGRQMWLLAGALFLIPTGILMVMANAWAIACLAIVIVHQMLYFVRQRRQELRAKTAEHADEARPAPATINGFFGALVLTVLAAWLGAEGALT
jgi:hypothetical protein